MRALLALALLVPLVASQDVQPAPAPQLTPPDPVPGEAIPEGETWQTTASGLRYVVLAKGDEAAARPGAGALATVRYSGYLESGTKFDGTRDKGTASFPLRKVIAGWTEAVQLMHPGAKYKFHIPWQIAYGERGSPPVIPAYSNLIFDIELVSFVEPPAFAMPADADLTTTPSGLKYQVVKEGREDGRKPVATDRVTVHYSGWLPSGKLFDSSYSNGSAASFGLNGVIKGWTEGLQLMREGAVYKFVIPPELGYGTKGAGRDIPPNATLVFQVELIKVGA